MATEPWRRSVAAGPSIDPVQPRNEAPYWLGEADWLTDSDQSELADRVDRLAADVDLVTTLALNGYKGSDWEYFSNELAKYGMAVIRAWMHQRIIFERCAAKGMGGLPRLDRWFDPDEVEELTNETVAKALRHFRDDVLRPGRWDPRRGATIRTYFIGQCLIRFSNVYRRWYGNETRRKQFMRANDDELLAARAADDTENTAVDRARALALLAQVKDPRVRRAMLLTAQGVAQADIALELGVTEKAVERMLANERARIRRRAG